MFAWCDPTGGHEREALLGRVVPDGGRVLPGIPGGRMYLLLACRARHGMVRFCVVR